MLFFYLQVQTETERAIAGGRKVEQVVTPLTPTVAGFRFDAPAAIRYAAKYNVSAFNEAQTTDMVLACCLDESHISPATLRIRVSVSQVSLSFSPSNLLCFYCSSRLKWLLL